MPVEIKGQHSSVKIKVKFTRGSAQLLAPFLWYNSAKLNILDDFFVKFIFFIFLADTGAYGDTAEPKAARGWGPSDADEWTRPLEFAHSLWQGLVHVRINFSPSFSLFIDYENINLSTSCFDLLLLAQFPSQW